LYCEEFFCFLGGLLGPRFDLKPQNKRKTEAGNGLLTG
jgi:hypothetical protein